MIPKTIHFCWLSGETMPAKMRRCRASWRRHLPGYAYALWDWRRVEACRAESGFDFAWVRHWYERKNYAFAADYLRLWALWREGGIYLDVDVEVLKPFDALLARGLLLGEEGGTGDVEAAVIGAEKGSAAIRAVLDSFGEPTAETLPHAARPRRSAAPAVRLFQRAGLADGASHGDGADIRRPPFCGFVA